MLTRCIILVGKVRSVFRARHKGAPKSSTIFALLDTREINMALKATLFEEICKCFVVDMVAIAKPQKNHEIIMAVYQRIISD